LIHGGGSTIQTTFGRILPELAKNHKVIAVEMQAHGHTADIDRPLSFSQDADDIAALLNFLHIDKGRPVWLQQRRQHHLAVRHPSPG
jgi:pimeloyl-ACP methyl ester carboxylesterase